MCVCVLCVQARGSKVEKVYNETVPVNSVSELRKRPPSLYASSKGSVMQKAKVKFTDTHTHTQTAQTAVMPELQGLRSKVVKLQPLVLSVCLSHFCCLMIYRSGRQKRGVKVKRR